VVEEAEVEHWCADLVVEEAEVEALVVRRRKHCGGDLVVDLSDTMTFKKQ